MSHTKIECYFYPNADVTRVETGLGRTIRVQSHFANFHNIGDLL